MELTFAEKWELFIERWAELQKASDEWQRIGTRSKVLNEQIAAPIGIELSNRQFGQALTRDSRVEMRTVRNGWALWVIHYDRKQENRESDTGAGQGVTAQA